VGTGDLVGGPDAVEHRVGFSGPLEVRVELADGTEADVVGLGVDAFDAVVAGQRRAAAGSAVLVDPGGAVGVGDHRPAAGGGVASGQGDDAGDGAVRTRLVDRVVHHPPPGAGSGVHRLHPDDLAPVAG